MILLRLVILLIVVALLLWLLRRLFANSDAAEQKLPPQSENMRQCKYCGIHVPESSIVTVDNKPYCCNEHADLDQ